MIEVNLVLTEGELIIAELAISNLISLLKAKGLDGTVAFNDFLTLALKLDKAGEQIARK